MYTYARTIAQAGWSGEQLTPWDHIWIQVEILRLLCNHLMQLNVKKRKKNLEHKEFS